MIALANFGNMGNIETSYPTQNSVLQKGLSEYGTLKIIIAVYQMTVICSVLLPHINLKKDKIVSYSHLFHMQSVYVLLNFSSHPAK